MTYTFIHVHMYDDDVCKLTLAPGEILLFFYYPLQPIPRLHIAGRDFQNSQRNASVQSLLLAGQLLYKPLQLSACEGEVAK